MKKLNLLLKSLLCSFCAIFLYGCEIVNILPSDNLYGTWVYEYVEQSNNTVYKFVKEITFYNNDEYELEACHYYDGQFDYDSYYYECGDFYYYGWDSLELTYLYNNRYYTDSYTYEISGDKMTLYYYLDGVYYTEIYLKY